MTPNSTNQDINTSIFDINISSEDRIKIFSPLFSSTGEFSQKQTFLNPVSFIVISFHRYDRTQFFQNKKKKERRKIYFKKETLNKRRDEASRGKTRIAIDRSGRLNINGTYPEKRKRERERGKGKKLAGLFNSAG